jgi:peroxiredoxin Q/BCP
MEGRGFRDRAPEFAEAGLEVVGASFDTPEDNRAFAEKNGFPFRFLSDVDRKVGELYETKRAPEEHSPEYAKRRTYLIDPEGRIVKAYRVSDIPAHPAQVLEDFRALAAGTSA